MKHIVLFSGGLSSYFATKRLLEKVDKSDVILLFTDTKMEDPDLYRFLDDAEKKLDVQITRLADGRNIWEVFRDVRFLGNSRVDPCSRILKRELSRKFISQFDPEEIILYLGFSWDELHRLDRARKFWSPYRVEAPMTEYPYRFKDELIELCEQDGIEVPRLYKLGFSHNNCGGGCVKAGIGHFSLLLEKLPEVYAVWEARELEMREYLGQNVAFLTRMVNGKKYPFTLKQLRERRETLTRSELCDIGGCGCFDAARDEFGVLNLLFDGLF